MQEIKQQEDPARNTAADSAMVDEQAPKEVGEVVAEKAEVQVENPTPVQQVAAPQVNEEMKEDDQIVEKNVAEPEPVEEPKAQPEQVAVQE